MLFENTVFRVYFLSPEDIEEDAPHHRRRFFIDPTTHANGGKVRTPASLITRVTMISYLRKAASRKEEVGRLEAFLELVDYCREMDNCEIDYSRFKGEPADLVANQRRHASFDDASYVGRLASRLTERCW